MFHYSKKSIEMKIEATKELLKNTRDKEEIFALRNYLGNLYLALYDLEHSLDRSGFYHYLGETDFKQFDKRMESSSNKWLKNSLENKVFHRLYLQDTVIGMEDVLEELYPVHFSSDDPIRRKELLDILYAFFESMGLKDLFERYQKENRLFAVGKNKERGNIGYLVWNPVSKEGDILIRNVKNDVRTMKTVAHEMGHVYDYSQLENVPQYNRYILTSLYGETVPRMFEKRLEHFLLENHILPQSAKKEIFESLLLYRSDVLKAFFYTILSHKTLRKEEYIGWKPEDFKKIAKKYFLDGLNYEIALDVLQTEDMQKVFSYAYGNIISLFLLDEMEKNGERGKLFDTFMKHRTEMFDPQLFLKCGFEIDDFLKLYQDEAKLVKK